ncbi:MAG: hypothetical protein GF355_18175, partial [Candidatus Eisenbacteria bacterium]|nr:hypothetical protein [Candidatus Eisenbacteria bacterium]
LRLPDTNRDGRYMTWGSAQVIPDLDGPGRPALMASVSSGFDLRPRGVYVFDLGSGSLLWSFPTAGWPDNLRDLLIQDVNGDGYTDAVFTCSGPSNQYSVNGMTDTRIYAVCLGGRERDSLWVHDLGDGWEMTRFLAYDVDEDGSDEIIVCQVDSTASGRSVIVKSLTPDSGECRQRSVISNLGGVIPIRSETAAGWVAGGLRIPGTDGRLYKVEFGSPNDLHGISDAIPTGLHSVLLLQLWDDPAAELLCNCSHGLVAMDGDLRRLAVYRSPERWKFRARPLAAAGHSDSLFILINSAGVSGTRVLRLLAPPLRYTSGVVPAVPWAAQGLLIGLGCGGLLAFLAAALRGARSREKGPGDDPEWAQLGRELTILVSWSSERLRSASAGSPAERERGDQRRAHDTRDQELSAKLRAALTDHAGLLSKQKNLGRTLQSLIGQLSVSAGKPLRLAADVMRPGIETIIQQIAGGMGTDPVRVVQHALHSRTELLQEADVDLRSLRIEGVFGGFAWIDAGDLRWIVEELVDNAVSAMKDSAQRRLDVAVRRDGDRVLVQIADSGCGIRPARIAEIFEPGETGHQGPGHGYGLSRARRLLDTWGGTIWIVRSDAGTGTAVELAIPYVDLVGSAGDRRWTERHT